MGQRQEEQPSPSIINEPSEGLEGDKEELSMSSSIAERTEFKGQADNSDEWSMEADSDSRKRPHGDDDASEDSKKVANDNSVVSAPHKKSKRGRKAKQKRLPDMVDSPPTGGGPSHGNLPIQVAGTKISLPQVVQTKSSMKKKGLRELKVEAQKIDSSRSASGLPTHLDMRQGGQDSQEGCTRLALSRLEGFRERLSGLNSHDQHLEYRAAQQEVHDAEVDYNYCLYYPFTKEWRPPPSIVNRDLSKTKKKVPPAKQWRTALWHLVEKSMRSGTLAQVKDGSYVASEIPTDIVNTVTLGTKQQRHDIANLMQQTNVVLSPDSSSDQGSVNSEQMMTNLSDFTSKEHTGRGVQGEHGLKVNREEESKREAKAGAVDPQRMTSARISSHNYIDLTSGSEEGEVGENPPESETDDAVMYYSNSNSVIKQQSGPLRHDGPSDLLDDGRPLQSLSPHALNKQLRYFHAGKLPEEIDLRLPINCLVCGKAGHDAESCKTLTCIRCGAHNEHMTERCPKNSKCPKCRETGHNESSCRYKLKNITLDEIICDLCQQNGHVEDDCELIWRTSHPWVHEAFDKARILYSCYECGTRGHLGNDCPTRRPDKGLGTSTWSILGKFDVPTRPEQHGIHAPSRPKRQLRGGKKGPEMKIKGQSQNQQAMYPPETLPDKNTFLRQKVPEPARKGKIQINAGTSQRFNEAPTPGQFSSISQPFGSYGSAQQPQYADYRNFNDPAYKGEAGLAHYNHGNPMHDGDYQNGPRRRSRSPSRDSRNRDHRNDMYQSGPSRPARGYRNENVYRPMPSAAQNAYSRHRM